MIVVVDDMVRRERRALASTRSPGESLRFSSADMPVCETPRMGEAELSIRAMESDDLDPLYEMYKEVVEEGGAVPADGEPTIDVFVEGWITNRSVFVAWRDGKAVGTYFVRSNFPAFAAHIAQGGYIVARRARRSGIGTELLRHSLDQAREFGFSAMMFNLVLESNPSRRLYEAAGFTVVGRIPEARGNEPGLIYWRHL